MKILLPLKLRQTITAIAMIPVLSAAPIELTDIEDRKIVAEIVSLKDDKVLIRKDDNKEYLIPMTRLTKESKELIVNEIARIDKFKWKYHVIKDDLTDKPAYFAEVQSINQVNFDFPYDGIQRGSFMLRTHPEYGKDLILEVEKGQMLVKSYESSTVDVVFDQGSPVSYKVIGSADHSTTSLFIKDKEVFIENMLKAKKLKISVPFYKQGNVVFEFDISEFNSEKYLQKNKK